MKLTISTVIAVIMLAVVFTGCKKDDDKKTANTIQIGDTVITITGGALINYGEGGYHEGYNLDLNLFGEGVTISEIVPGVRDIDGAGFRFYCEMFSDSSSMLVDGTYAFDNTSSVSPASTFDYGDYSFSNGYEHPWLEYEEGTIKVKKTGDNYELIINCVDEDDNVITGYYKGPLQFFIDDDAMAK
jgi:hypothetical protein